MVTRAIDILQASKRKGVHLFLENGQLQVKYAKEKGIDEQLLADIRSNKELIISFLKDDQANGALNGSGSLSIPALSPGNAHRIPLSFSQERLWFIDRLEGSTQYHMPAVLRLKGKLNFTALENSLLQVVTRQQVLRTVFKQEAGQTYQHVNDAWEWKINIIEGSQYVSDADALRTRIQQLIGKPFDLSQDYMLRADLINLLPDEQVLVVTMHHIASDGWSRSILVREVLECYRAYEERTEPKLQPLPIQYADFAAWQREHLSGPALEEKLNYWRSKLADVPPLQLPTDFSRPAIQDAKGARIQFKIDKQLSEKLKELSHKVGATLFMTLLSVFKVLLYRYSGQRDICVGVPIAGRLQPEVEGLIGFFANTLALRSELNDDLSFLELLQQIRRTTIEAQQLQEVPFEKVVDAVVKERTLSRNPLIQVLFALQNVPEVPDLKLNEIEFSRQEFEHTTAMFDMSFFVSETSGGLGGTVEYATALFDQRTIDQMVKHYKSLLSSIIMEPGGEIGELSMLEKEDEERLLTTFNDNSVNYPDKTIIQLFEETVAIHPEKTALICDDKQITYKELNESANRLANYLKGRGVKKEIMVPVCIGRGFEMLVGILGVLKSGGAYVPIDPDYPQERISFILKDVDAKIVVSSTAVKSKMPALRDIEIIELDNDANGINEYPANNLETKIEAKHLAYVIYTSGSTGKPKGVMIEHKNVHAFISWCREEFASSSFEIVYASTSMCFDLSVFEFFYPLSIGKPIRIIENGLHIGKYLKADKYIMTNSVPVVIENILKEGRDLSNISVINMAGEPVPLQVQQNLDTDRIEVRNLYGPTEDTTYSTVYRLRKNTPILIGRPISNSAIYIVDKKGKLVPVGVAGEICIGGAGVARGYLNSPELTGEKFIKNRFSQNAMTERLYCTGDLGRWLPDGNIEYLGRVDDQVKIRGYRIELGEVETALGDLEQVSSSCVVVKKHPDSQNTLVGFWIPESQAVKAKERELYQAQVSIWKDVYEVEYQQTEGGDLIDEEFNIIGWNDSFTGGAIPGEQMSEWVREIVDRIFSLSPENVLEIGCGTGLIYYQLAGKVKKYLGSDFSRSSINQINSRIHKGVRDYGPTRLFVSAAHEITVNEDEEIDTIILNSVVQYFPGEEYMSDVITNCLNLLNGKGKIIIGDVRDNRLLHLFKARLSLDKLPSSLSIKEFQWVVDQEILKEEELCFSPGYFYNLKSIFPAISHVEIQWKNVSFINELSLYRYTVVIYVGIEAELLRPRWLSLSDGKNKQQALVGINNEVEAIALRDVPNPRLWKERQLAKAMESRTLNSVGDLLSELENENDEGSEIRDLLNLAKSKGYQSTLLVDRDPLKINLLLELRPSENKFIEQLYEENEDYRNEILTNIPLFTDVCLLLQKELKASLKQRLPEYMIPSEMIALSHLPLNTNGKIDRKFLSEREDIVIANRLNYQAPESTLEVTLAGIWQELLHIERVGVQDNFFELGGHSLLVMRLISAIRRELDVELAIKDLFIYPTVAKLAGYINALQSEMLVLPQIKALERPSSIPLSFSQERLWFVDRLEGSVAFHLPAVFKLSGSVNIEALKYSFETIVDRHEVLRTVFLEEDGIPHQFVKEKGGWELAITNASNLKNDDKLLRKYINEKTSAPFNLCEDYTLRAELLIIGEEEHVLIVTLHHIASDAWSLGIMVKEVVELYRAFENSMPVSLSSLEVQYADYAIWQRNYLSGDLFNRKLNYWKAKLNGIEPLQIPTDFPRPALQSTKGATTKFLLKDSIAEQIKDFSQQQESTLFMTLLAAFKVLFYRYTGQRDICMGTSTAGRQQQEIESLIGFFVNILALRTEVNPETSFIDLLQKVKQTTLEAYEHQEVPFEKVVDAVVRERDISRTPLFQVLFVVLNTPDVPEIALGDLTLSRMGSEQATSKYDITFFVTQSSKGISGYVEYSTELFKEETIARMVLHFNELLHSILQDPGKKISALRFITSEEEDQLLHTFNNTFSPYPNDKIIAQFFAEQVRVSPAAVALVYGDEQLTYTQLNERANKLARYLRMKGVRENSLIAICIGRSVEMMVGILGILKAGAAYVPIDPAYPKERIDFMLSDTASSFILTTRQFKSVLPENNDLEIIVVDEDETCREVGRQETEDLVLVTNANSLAYVIYTSGSTGKPKGVLVTQKNVVSLVKGVSYVSLSADDILLSTGSSSFDATTIEYWGMLLNGGRILLCDEERLLDHELLKEEINSRKVNKMWFTSGWFNQLVETDISIFKNLTTILVGGEKLSPQHIEKLRKAYPSIEIINGYGPTENTTFSLTYNITETKIDRPIPIGRPLDNRKAFILDENQQLVPVGVSGEICLSGDGLSLGYLNRPELNEEKFVNNPFDEGLMYKTGDIGRWLPDGNVEYLGRKDDQVKIRGYRIELGEIENVLKENELVKAAAVLVKTDQEGNKRLIGYVVPAQEFDKNAIQVYLKNKLPDYMIPTALIEIENLPLNANGKVDRKALPDPTNIEQGNNQYAAPQNEKEEALVQIWQRLLDIEEVSVQDNFFEIGGDSLLAIRVISAIRKELNVEIPIGKLFEFQTIWALASQIETTEEEQLLPVIEKLPRPELIPLSFSQERLWFIDNLEGSLQYHIPSVIRLKGALDKDALSFALRSLIERHEVLRTVFIEKDGEAWQFVKAVDDWEIFVMDGWGFKDDQPGLQDLIQGFTNTPFDLSKDFMLRANLVMLQPQEHLLVLNVHHIAFDGWSRSIMVREVAEFYKAFSEGRDPQLPTLPIQYADFAIWQRNYLKDEVLQKKLEYWEQKLRDVEPLQMPLDFKRPAVQSSRGSSVGFSFDKKLSGELNKLGKQHDSTLFMTLLAALKVLLYRYTGQEDICVGTGIAGRQQQEVEVLIGFFVNSLAIRTQLNGESDFGTLLQQVRKNTLEAYENQEVPFEKIVDVVVKKRDQSRNPIFQVMFVLQNTPEVARLELGELELERSGYEHTTAQFDLSFSITETESGLNGSVEYNVDLFSKQTVSRILGHFNELLGSIVNTPEKKISDLPILGASEEHQLMEDFNDTHSAYPHNKNIADLFEEQVAKTPGQTAVVYMEESLTYKQLDDRSNQLANYLIEKGIRSGDNVGLLSSRSLEMIIGIFGIIKTGAVYVPFNTEYPAERLQYVVENAGIKHIVYTDIDLLKRYEFTNCECIDLNRSSECQTQNKRVKVSIDSPVYIMYTSGTTGRPKGILVSNRNVVKLVHEPGDIAVKPGDRMLQWSNYAFDGCVYEIYSSLLKGASLYLVKDEWASNVYELGRVIKEQKITVCFITTALFNTFIDVDPDMLLGLRKILFGGEMVSLSHVRKALQVIGPGKIVHVYGPTETSVYATYFPLNVIGEDGIIPIGKPLANTQLYVLDAYAHLVPIGGFGELFIGGDGVSLGYVNNQALTLEKFVTIPGISNERRLYRTGDIVRRLPDGNIVYIGRIDNQVKIRGYRIEPGEIENLLQESDMIAKAVVMVKENIEGNKSLVGYIVPNESYNKQILISTLQAKLPEYMIPASWVELQSFPLNASGKIDKKALPDPDVTQLLSDQYMKPSNEIERKLVQIWQNILRKDRVGINDNFFELGGHSLLAMRLISAVRKELEVELAVKELFLNPTIVELGSSLQKQKEALLLPPIEAYPRPEHIPISFSQQRLWFVDQLEGSVQYNSPTALRLKGFLDIDALNYALKNIITRHEVLRTVFYEEGGNPYQLVMDPADWKMSVLDGKIYKEDRVGLHNFIETTVTAPFDLSNDYMLRADLISIDEEDNVLVVTMHHIASDGWSLPIIVKEVMESYSSFIEKRKPELPELKLQYADYSIWQRKYLVGEVLERKTDYWKQKLNGIVHLDLPTDYSRPAVRTLRGASVNVMIEKDLAAKLEQLSNGEGVTLFMTLLATYNVLLQRYSGQEDICVGASIANRPQQELEDLVGFFVNTLALRNRVEETDTFTDLLQQVKTTTLEAYSNQEVPFEKVVEEVVKERDPARSPLFQVMLVLLNTPGSKSLESGNLELSPEGVEITISKFDITFHVSQSEHGLPITIVYNTDLYKEETIRRMGGHFKQLLYSVVKDPKQTLDLLQMLTAEEEQQLLVEFN